MYYIHFSIILINIKTFCIKLPHPAPGTVQVDFRGIVGSNITGIKVIIATNTMSPIMNRIFLLFLVYNWFVSKVINNTSQFLFRYIINNIILI